MSQVPSHYAEEIKRFDPLLRLRWSKEKQKFILERKVPSILKKRMAAPVLYRRGSDGKVREIVCPEDSDRRISYRDGYMEILVAKVIDRRIMRVLYQSDTLAKSKYYLKEFEEKERKNEERENNRDREQFEDVTGDAYDHLLYKQGERMSMGGK